MFLTNFVHTFLVYFDIFLVGTLENKFISDFNYSFFKITNPGEYLAQMSLDW